MNKNKRQHLCFFAYATRLIEARRRAGRHNTADLYRTTRNWVCRFMNDKELDMRRITPAWIARFADFLRSEGLLPNSVRTYLSNLRAIYNQACREGLLPRLAGSPFEGLVPRKERGESRALDGKVLEEIAALRPGGTDKRKELALDLARFSLLVCGIPFVDLVRLTSANIQGNELVYRRKKTGALIRVGLTPAARGLIEKYAVEGNRYLFPILPADRAVGHEAYKALLGAYNRTLKEIGASLSTPVRLTSYTMRHSWATNAYRRHVPLSVISQALGHASEQTTRHYLAALDQSELNLANERVTGEFERLLATG
ncbi:tyrosine-type recombinase/integrase [Parabacteroides sp.]